ncbi:MAG: thioredoxin [Methanosarcinaceae archaeon]|nr:thioredoxin [Methanosarcinaceae archaeon]
MDELVAIRKKKMDQLRNDLSRDMEREGFPNSPITATDANLKDLISKYPLIVVDCWAPWCAPCRRLSPIIDQLASEYQGSIVFGKLNTDENRSTAMNFQITGIPAQLVFKNGILVDQIVGALPKEHIVRKLMPFM